MHKRRVQKWQLGGVKVVCVCVCVEVAMLGTHEHTHTHAGDGDIHGAGDAVFNSTPGNSKGEHFKNIPPNPTLGQIVACL